MGYHFFERVGGPGIVYTWRLIPGGHVSMGRPQCLFSVLMSGD